MKIQSAKAGIGTGRAGLQAASGLFSSAGLFDKGVKSFNPLDLDPYLLFDAQTSMIGTLENPTLDLDPATPSTLDVITATRAGTATFTDANGLIATAQPDSVRVDYTQGAELTPNIFQLVGNTNFGGWVIQSNTTLTSNTTETLSPDGTNNATKMTSNGSEGLYIPSLGTASLNTKSIFLKGVSGGEQVILQDPHQNIDPLTCTLTTEWQRFHLTQTQTGSFGLWLTNIPSGGIYAYGPQVQVQGLTDFVANTTGSPKFITGATYGPRVPMILVEPSATNLLLYSEDFSHAGWTKVYDVVVTPSSVDAPDGTTNAFKLSELNLSDGDYGLSEFLNTSPSTSYTFSTYFKAASDGDVGKKVRIRIRRNAGTSISASNSVTLTSEWVRHSVTIDLLSDNTSCWFVIAKDTASSTAEQADECLIWGAQVETGSIATSYIPTSGSTVTRAADNLVISGSDFSDFFNASEGTTYMETAPKTTTNIPHIFEYHNSSDANANRMGAYLPNISLNAYVRSSGVTTVSLFPGSINLNQLNRVAISYKVNDILGSLNGSSEVADTSAALPSGLDKLHIGNVYNFNFPLNGHIKRLIYWPYHSDSL